MAREKRRARSHFRRDHRGQSIFLVALAAIIVAPAFGPVGLRGRLLGDALASLMLVSGGAAVTDRPRAELIVSVITVVALLVRWANWLFPAADLAWVKAFWPEAE